MAIKCLVAEKQETGYFFRYTLDDTKKLADGSPEPAMIREYTFPMLDGSMVNNETDKVPVTESEYLNNIKKELQLLNQFELDSLNPAPAPAPTPLSGF